MIISKVKRKRGKKENTKRKKKQDEENFALFKHKIKKVKILPNNQG